MGVEYSVFISYRRTDDHSAGRLSDRLVREFGTFYDRAVPRGREFTPETLAALEHVPVVVAVIGRGWLSAPSLERLNSPDDWLRRELEKALARSSVLLIPVLVDDVDMPDRQMLPESLRALCDRQAMRLRVDSWERDVEALVRDIKHGVIDRPDAADLKRGAGPSGGRPVASGNPPPTAPVRKAGIGSALIHVLVACLAVLAGVVANQGWERVHDVFRPGLTSGRALGVASYHRRMGCGLPLGARPGATVTFQDMFIRSSRDCEGLFEDALKSGVRMRVLVIDPFASTVGMRVDEFKSTGKYTLKSYRDEIVDSLQTLQRIMATLEHAPGMDIHEALQVRLYDGLPNMPIYVVHHDKSPQDDVIYQGFYLAFGNGSNDLPAVELSHPGSGHDRDLFDSLRRYVDEKWSSSTPTDLLALRRCTRDGDIPRWLECLRTDLRPAPGRREESPAGRVGAPAAAASR